MEKRTDTVRFTDEGKPYLMRPQRPLGVFAGEMMTCILCGRSQFSHPKVQSNWLAARLHPEHPTIYYACPACQPIANRAKPTTEEWEDFYRRFLERVAEIETKPAPPP